MAKKPSSDSVNNRTTPLLSVKNLCTSFFLPKGELRAVDNVSFSVSKCETVGIVGESGCGKSMTALSVMNLIPRQNSRIIGGAILFKGENLLEKSEEDIKKIQGNDISMIFQEPMTSLNPVLSVGWQISENLRTHLDISAAEARKRAIEMLEKVNIPMARRRYKEYPHQLSGGMRQRIMIAMALACNPELLICDEPTTALDVTVQAQILRLLETLKRENDMSMILISHDLGIVSQLADKVIIMYAGEIVEMGRCEEIFENPMHPYTKALLKSVPRIDRLGKTQLYTIKGTVPELINMPQRCRFADRCEDASEYCFSHKIDLNELEEGGRCVRCCRFISEAM